MFVKKQELFYSYKIAKNLIEIWLFKIFGEI